MGPLAPSEELLHLFPGPRRPTQKRQARLDARIVGEAPDFDFPPEFLPTVIFDQFDDHHFEGDAGGRMLALWHVKEMIEFRDAVNGNTGKKSRTLPVYPL